MDTLSALFRFDKSDGDNFFFCTFKPKRLPNTIFPRIDQTYRFASLTIDYSLGGRGLLVFTFQHESVPSECCRRKYRRHNRTHIFDVQSLSHRPESVADRKEFGHWECDLMMFRKELEKVNVTSLVERVSRFAVVMRSEDRQSKPIMEALIQGLAPLPADGKHPA